MSYESGYDDANFAWSKKNFSEKREMHLEKKYVLYCYFCWEKPKTFHFLFTQSIEEKFSNSQIKQSEKICKIPTVEWLSHCISDARPSDKLLHWPASLEVDAASR